MISELAKAEGRNGRISDQVLASRDIALTPAWKYFIFFSLDWNGDAPDSGSRDPRFESLCCIIG